MKTQVIFEGYSLILRYKKKDDGTNQFNYVIEKEWAPQPCDFRLSLTSASRDPNKHETPTLDISRHSESYRTIMVTGIPQAITATNAKQEFMKIISDEDSALIEDVRFKAKGTIILICRDWPVEIRISLTIRQKILR